MNSEDSDWPFDNPPNVACITVRQVIEGAPILLAMRDAEDGGWQFLTGESANMDDAMLVSLKSMVDRDTTLFELANMKPGWLATKECQHSSWKVWKESS